MTRFSNAVITPAVDDQHSVVLTNIAPDAARLVTLEVKGAKYGTHDGWLVVRGSADTVRLNIHTFTFP